MTNKIKKGAFPMEVKRGKGKPIPYANKYKKSLYLLVYNSIRDQGRLPKEGISKSLLEYYVYRLKKEGLIKRIGYATWEVNQTSIRGVGLLRGGLGKTLYFPQETKGGIKSDFIRIHNILFKLKIVPILNWEARIKNKGINYKVLKNNVLSFVFKDFRIWLCREKIIIYFLPGVDFIADNVYNSVYLAVKSFLAFLPELEEVLGFGLKVEGHYIWALDRKHLSLVKNAFAKQLNRDNEKLRVYDDRGLWLLVDNSFNLNELEAVRSETNNREADRVQKFFNDLKNLKELILISDLYALVTGLATNQVYTNDNLKKISEALNYISERLNK